MLYWNFKSSEVKYCWNIVPILELFQFGEVHGSFLFAQKCSDWYINVYNSGLFGLPVSYIVLLGGTALYHSTPKGLLLSWSSYCLWISCMLMQIIVVWIGNIWCCCPSHYSSTISLWLSAAVKTLCSYGLFIILTPLWWSVLSSESESTSCLCIQEWGVYEVVTFSLKFIH